MHSKQLQSLFPDIYKDFFLQHEIIVSLPFLFMRSSDIISTYTGVRVQQKVPLRAYVGFSHNESGAITLKDIVYYSKESKNFTKEPIKEYISQFIKLEELIQKKYEYLLDTCA